MGSVEVRAGQGAVAWLQWVGEPGDALHTLLGWEWGGLSRPSESPLPVTVRPLALGRSSSWACLVDSADISVDWTPSTMGSVASFPIFLPAFWALWSGMKGRGLP